MLKVVTENVTEVDWLISPLSEEDTYRRPWLVLGVDW